LFLRKKGFREDQLALKSFEREIAHLKRLSHHHLVKLVGSYTDSRYMAFLMEPVADGNLMSFLCQPSKLVIEQLPSLRNFFGCLANAVAYLHAQKFRHRDLKPENILIKDFQLYITDFGNSLDWSQKGRDTTLDANVPRTWRYVAPEIAQGVRRNSASDIWSLGVIFLEMLTVLRGRTVREMRIFVETHGNRQAFVYANLEATTQWFEKLLQSGPGPDSDNEPLEWIKEMTQPIPARRPRAWDVTNQIRSSTLTTSFIGFCCANESGLHYCASPPSSVISDEEDKVSFRQQLQSLEPVERQYGYFISSSKQSSVEKWLDIGDGPAINESHPTASNEMNFLLEDLYEISEDETFRSLSRTTTGRDLFTNLSSEPMIIEDYDTYEVISDDSDDEKAMGADPYEVMEDSSGSEVTVRPIPQAQAIEQSESQISTSEDESYNGLGNQIPLFEEQTSLTASKQVRIKLDELDRNEECQETSHFQNRFVVSETGYCEDRAPVISSIDEDLPFGTSPSDKNQGASAGTGHSPETIFGKSNNVPLTAQNLTKYTASDPQTGLESANEQAPKRLAWTLAPPAITPDIYMRDVWEAASTIETSVLSSQTSETLGCLGISMRWQDHHMHFLESYAKKGKAAAVRELLLAGCNPGTLKKPNYRPLISAVRAGSRRHNKVVKVLLDHGADVNVQHPNTGKTSLHFAIEHQNFEGYTNLVRDLLEAGADPNILDKNGDSPILQIWYGGYEPLAKHKLDALACLLQQSFNTDVNIVSRGTRNMPIHIAVRRRDAMATALLIHRGSRVNDPNGAGATPLRITAGSWNEKPSGYEMDLLRFLLKGGANVNEQGGTTNDTVLHIAASQGCEEALDLLLRADADPHIQDGKGHTAYQIAEQSKGKVNEEKRDRIMNLLRSYMNCGIGSDEVGCSSRGNYL
ncbi:MAG: hypothetical protein Q9167_007365, partial [Letrouitia subvulpina]